MAQSVSNPVFSNDATVSFCTELETKQEIQDEEDDIDIELAEEVGEDDFMMGEVGIELVDGGNGRQMQELKTIQMLPNGDEECGVENVVYEDGKENVTEQTSETCFKSNETMAPTDIECLSAEVRKYFQESNGGIVETELGQKMLAEEQKLIEAM